MPLIFARQQRTTDLIWVGSFIALKATGTVSPAGERIAVNKSGHQLLYDR